MKNIYIMSDIHGQYDLFKKMLDKIKFNQEDELYIIGDVIDKGDDCITLLKYIMKEKNIILLKGNHEDMMVESLLYKNNMDNKDNEQVKYAIIVYLDWLKNSGTKTLENYRKESITMQKEILEYLQNLDLYKKININNKNYLLIHSGLYIPQKNLPLDILIDANIKARDIMLYIREDFLNSKYYIDNYQIIVGHTPTNNLPNILSNISNNNIKRCKENKIYKDKNKIIIDCGCYKKNGNLACLRLNDMKEFYIKNKK